MGQNPTDSEVNDMINEVDVDGSGVVEFEEFVNFFSRLMKNLNPQNEVREAFRRLVHSLIISLKIDQLDDDASSYNVKQKNINMIIKLFTLMLIGSHPNCAHITC